jgi:hypothetical protein
VLLIAVQYDDSKELLRDYIIDKLDHSVRRISMSPIIKVCKNMKAKIMSLWDRVALSERFIFEKINDQLKNISFIEHSRYGGMKGFMLNLFSRLVAYCLKKDKPSLV